MEPKPKYKTKQGNGRLRFDAIDMLRQARGLPTPEGYVVLTKDFVQFVEDELKRLYAVEDVATEYSDKAIKEEYLRPNQDMNDVLEALGLPVITPPIISTTAGRDATPVVQNGRQVVDL